VHPARENPDYTYAMYLQYANYKLTITY